MSKNRKKEWPKDVLWPEPTDFSINYDEDMIPDELDEEAEDLIEIKDYFDGLREDGILDDDYRPLNLDDDFEPEKGEDYWTEEGFEHDAWLEDLSDHINLLKIAPVGSFEQDPVAAVREACGYSFINENLLRQAFTRRSIAIEHGLEAARGKEGCSEELEFIGDSIISMVVTREITRQFTQCDCRNIEAPFESRYREGELSKLRAGFIGKEHLSERAKQLDLDRFILYGTGEEASDSSREDMMEALVGAIAVDCNWEMLTLEAAVNKLLYIQLDSADRLLKRSCYDLLNSWHQKHFGCSPTYEVYGGSLGDDREWKNHHSVIRFFVPDNDKGINTAQCLTGSGETISKAREDAARAAYDLIYNNGLWIDLKNAGIVFDSENSINQLQELYQKKYLEAPAEYEFNENPDGKWSVECRVGGTFGWGSAQSKVKAKKKAAYMALQNLMKGAGII